MERNELAMTPSTRNTQSGFLLIEVLAALALLSIALLAMTPMFVMAGRQNTAAGDITFATNMARDKAETLKATAYSALTPGSDSLKLRGVGFVRSWTVTNDSPHTGMKTVVVTVTPRRGRNFGVNRTARVSTYRVP